MRFVIPLPPQRANAREHWRVTHRKKLDYWASLDTIQLLGKRDGFEIPPPPRRPLPKAKAHATMFMWNLMDPYNCGARMKHVEDWLVTRGYIQDDRMKVLQWANVPEQVIARIKPRHDRIELTLEAL